MNERELFFLLGTGRNADLLQRLMYKTQVKASVRSHPSVLRLTGPLGQVEAVRAEWTRTKAEIRTDILETHLSKRLRPDLYKSLSMVSDAFVAPHSKSAKQIKVSYRTRQKGPVGKVEAALRHLRLQVRLFRDLSML